MQKQINPAARSVPRLQKAMLANGCGPESELTITKFTCIFTKQPFVVRILTKEWPCPVVGLSAVILRKSGCFCCPGGCFERLC